MDIDIERLKTDAAYWDDLFSPCTKRIAIETDENGYIAQIATKHPLSGGSFEMISPNNSIKFVERPTKPAAPEWDGWKVGDVVQTGPNSLRYNVEWTNGDDVLISEIGRPYEVNLTKWDMIMPIRTKEQRDREETVDAALSLDEYPGGKEGVGGLMSRRGFCEKLYDAGMLRSPEDA